MITVQRPGQESIQIESILLDFEGTLATDRRVHPKAKDKINLLSKRTKIFILTTGEKEVVSKVLRNVKAEIIFLREGDASRDKMDLLKRLGADRTAAIGNGVDDVSVIEAAALGMAVMGKEGMAAEVSARADVFFKDILDALDFLLKPMRQKATLTK